MSGCTWQVKFYANDYEGKASDVIFDLECRPSISDAFWFTEDDHTGEITIEAASDTLHVDSEEALEQCLKVLWGIHKATITGVAYIQYDDGSTDERVEWNDDRGELIYGHTIDVAEYTVEQLNKIWEYAESLKHE